MSKLKLMLVTSIVSLVALAGLASADRGHHGNKEARMKARAARIAQFDANRNGTLERAEKQAMFDARIAARFAALDTNKDGAITLAELKAGTRMRRGGKHVK